MNKKRQAQMILLAGLLLVLLYMGYRSFHPVGVVSAVAGTNEAFAPISVENPELRLDLLDKLKKLEYQGPQRNIFIATPPPPPAAAHPAPPPPPPPPPPSGPPPLTVPATFFGYVSDARTGTKRAFFTSGDDVYVLAVGEVLQGRFRLLDVGVNTAELEEVASGRKATLTLQDIGS